ncbi:MAG: carbohydrate kinase, partial [Candidatus Pacebacteria bacterium]|nr:carbohydrate kinase [Candidatus Paceibacterota bacterium]
MDAHRLQTLLDRLPQVQIGVIGDFCLDVYWTLDMSASEVSLETGLPTRPVRKQSYSLGGAGNVVSNLTAMGVGTVQAFGVIGADPFGRELRRLLTEQEVVVEGLLVQDETWDTPSYVKPISGEDEENRLDLGGFNHLSDKTATALLDSVRRALGELDLVIINQQLTHGIHTTFLQQELHQLIHRLSDTLFLTDCRQG